jgi:hypothetical protein
MPRRVRRVITDPVGSGSRERGEDGARAWRAKKEFSQTSL